MGLCPHCGYCPTCGRSNRQFGYWPYQYPWTQWQLNSGNIQGSDSVQFTVQSNTLCQHDLNGVG